MSQEETQHVKNWVGFPMDAWGSAPRSLTCDLPRREVLKIALFRGLGTKKLATKPALQGVHRQGLG